MNDHSHGEKRLLVERSDKNWKHIEILYGHFNFARRNRSANPGVASIQAAYEFSQATLLTAIHQVTGHKDVELLKKSGLVVQSDGLLLDDSKDVSTGDLQKCTVSELVAINSKIELAPSAFMVHDDAERPQVYMAKWKKLMETSKKTGVVEVVLGDWPDDLLTEFLWDFAHRRSEPAPSGGQSGAIEFVFDDESRLSYPRLGLKFRNRDRRRSAEPSKSQLFLSMTSNRHPELDSITHGSLFMNRETQLDGQLATLALATKNRAMEFFLSFGDGSPNYEVHIFQTGLAAVVVGLWIGVSEILATRSDIPLVIPRYYRENSYPEGRCW